MDLTAVDGNFPRNYKSLLLVFQEENRGPQFGTLKKLERGAAAFLARFGS